MFRSSSLSLKPSDINYTCSAMGVTIEELDIQVSEGMKGGPEPHPRRLPKIQVFLHNGQYFTLNNTELHLCHLLERRGEIKTVRVNMVPKSKIPAEVIKLLLPEGERSESSSHTDTQGKWLLNNAAVAILCLFIATIWNEYHAKVNQHYMLDIDWKRVLIL